MKIARTIAGIFKFSAPTFSALVFLVSCGSSSGQPGDSETDSETASGGEDTNSDTETGSAPDSETTDLIDHSNETPLEPTADCVHPKVVADCTDGWCRIPAGCFIFGSVDGEGNFCRARYAEDQVQVTLTHDFEIGQTEATQAQWKAAGLQLPNRNAENPCDDCPVTWITIYEAMAYANALSAAAGLTECYDLSDCTGAVGTGCPEGEKTTWGCKADDVYVCTGRVEKFADPYSCTGYRLPTAAEWEYAARAGTRTATYLGDIDDITTLECVSHPSVDDIAWHCGNIGEDSEEIEHPLYIPSGGKAPNGFGLYDMLGSVEEFVAATAVNAPLDDRVGMDGPLVDPAPELDDYIPVELFVTIRGGSYRAYTSCARSARVIGTFAENRLFETGFRLVRTLGLPNARPERSNAEAAIPSK